MPKNDNPHAMRLFSAVAVHSDEQTAQRIADMAPLSKSADAQKKFEWAERVCAALESELGDSATKAVRVDCACGPETGKMNKLKKLHDSSADLRAFAAKATAQNAGFTLECAGAALVLTYPQCYCSCVKSVDRLLPAAWCYCTLGYAKRMFEYVLGREVMVELLQSVKTGGDACKIKIT